MQPEFLAVGRLVDAVGVERALECLAALLEIGRQRAVHQAERVAIDQHLVLGIDRGDAVFHVEDGDDRRFQDHIGDAGRIVLADRWPRSILSSICMPLLTSRIADGAAASP